MEDERYTRALRLFGLINHPDLPVELTSPENDAEFLVALLAECRTRFSARNVRNRPNAPDVTHQISDSTENGFIIAKPGFGFTKEGQKAQLDLFLRRKRRLSKYRVLLKKKFPRGIFPEIHEKEEWYAYCLGVQKHDKDTGAISQPELTACASTSENQEFRLKLMGKPPLLSVVIHLKQRAVRQLLEYQKDWLQEGNYTHDNAVWIFALLACLKKPVYPATQAVLRSISILCSSFRAEIQDPASDILKSLNLIMSIIAYAFDQKDLCDDFASG